ncbi:right-handed parallel beta-helix repeat-containing protein [Flavobacterium aestuarii]|uniref:right-handed parallel beta-helix repeat-containing protein n=1 Tax=Flavobacterium aestuarii TaxID=3149227 RepID=UPI0032B34C8F
MKNLSFLFLLIFASCHSQIKYSPIPEFMVPDKYNFGSVLLNTINTKDEFYDLTNSLPKNYVTDATVDYTEFLQKGLKEHKKTIFPNFPVLINDAGLDIESNSTVNFQDNSVLVLKPSSKETYEMLRLHQVENIIINNAHIIGDREMHLGTTGEWGMGIAIRSSKNVKILNSKIEKCWGDGIYVGQIWIREKGKKAKLLEPSENVNIYNTSVDYCRRNGLSIVAVDGINVYNSLFANSIGTFPKAGIDIEPGEVDNVKIVNTNTYNNGARGIDLMLKDIGKDKSKKINVVIENHKDLLSATGLRIAGYKDLYPSSTITPIEGKISIINPQWDKNSYGTLVVEPNQSLAPQISIQGLKSKSKNGENLSVSKIKKSAKVSSGLKSNAKIDIN